MHKISFSPRSVGGGTIIVGGLPRASGDSYLKADGSNTVAGALQPNADITLSIGRSGLAFASGAFKAIYIDTPEVIAGTVTNSGVALIDVIATTFVEWFLRNPANSAYYPGTALQFITTSSGIAMSGSELKMLSDGELRFVSGGTPTTGAQADIVIHRKSAGWVRIGNSGASDASGAIDCASGVFKSGVMLGVSGQSSGSRWGVDNNGILTVTGPFNV